MKVIDLTRTLSADMPIYPGTSHPSFSPLNTIEKEGFKETEITINSHQGTHMDAPAHIFSGAAQLDELPASAFCGSGCVVDCRAVGEGGFITMKEVDSAGERAMRADFLIFLTGWGDRWEDASYLGAFPAFEPEVMRLCAGRKGVGIDCISIDPIDSFELPIHRIILSEGRVVVENLTNLEALVGKDFDFFALPLKYKNADGAPVRAIAVLKE